MKESPREHFRWAPHTGGLAVVKLKDYEPGSEAEALTPYALWKRLSEDDQGRDALEPGDLLEAVTESGPSALFILKYIGFEPAQWFVAAPKGDSEPPAAFAPESSASQDFHAAEL